MLAPLSSKPHGPEFMHAGGPPENMTGRTTGPAGDQTVLLREIIKRLPPEAHALIKGAQSIIVVTPEETKDKETKGEETSV